MITNIYVFQVSDTGDPSRMAAQVISGVGFLGAGSIIVTKRNQIRGLTTAAGLWASACLGLTVGVGLYELAAVGCLAIFIVLRVLIYWDVHIKGRRNLDVYVELRPGTSFPSFLRDAGIHVADIHLNTRVRQRLSSRLSSERKLPQNLKTLTRFHHTTSCSSGINRIIGKR